jgi:hypothetical protein
MTRDLLPLIPGSAWRALFCLPARTLWGTKNCVDVSGLEGVPHQAHPLAGAVHTGRSTALSGPWTAHRIALTSRSDRERAVILVREHDGGC